MCLAHEGNLVISVQPIIKIVKYLVGPTPPLLLLPQTITTILAPPLIPTTTTIKSPNSSLSSQINQTDNMKK
ncbi:hypothetical protein Hanom_Chr06g00568731 [Helianthus anomalus]